MGFWGLAVACRILHGVWWGGVAGGAVLVVLMSLDRWAGGNSQNFDKFRQNQICKLLFLLGIDK